MVTARGDRRRNRSERRSPRTITNFWPLHGSKYMVPDLPGAHAWQ